MGNNQTAPRLVEDQKRIADLMITYVREDMRVLGECIFSMGIEVGNDTGQAGGYDGSESMI
jgi:hypothetical protein